jgi:hypothetical protein
VKLTPPSFVGALLAAVLCACAGAPPAPDPVGALNRAAREAYAEARGRALEDAGPVLIVGPTEITFLSSGVRTGYELASARYQELKSMSHLALGLHALRYRAVPGAQRVAALRSAAEHALESLRALTPAQIERQREIVRRCFDESGSVERRERALAPLLLANAVDAARAEIDDLDAAVAAVRSALTPEEFARLQVIVVGAHMAREGEIAMQYFERLLGEREGRRLVFAEGLWDEPSQLQLLATHLLDASIGESFFGDPLRMHRDLLSDAAAQVLAERHR